MIITAPTSLITPTQLIPRGIYKVGDQQFTSKVLALQHSDKTGKIPSWHFYDEEFSKFNWTTEPSNSLEYYYALRCHQIRDKYDYLVLHYSGGGDSHNILTSFWKNNIHIDEIIVALPIKYFEKSTKANKSTLASESQNEWFYTIKPDLKWIAENMPRTKITIYDYTDDMLDFNVDQDWILHAGEHINPNIANRIHRYYKINSNDVYNKYTVGHLYGIDKPLVFKHNNEWHLSFLDSMISIQASFKPVFDHHTHINVEYFYWSSDLPEMLIKQAHAVKNYYENNPQFLHLATHSQKTLEEKEQERNLTRRAVYPYWRESVFQTAKVTNTFFKEFDLWFFDLASENAQSKWYEGYNFLINGVDKKWIRYDKDNKPCGLVGIYAPWYKLGASTVDH